MWTLILTLMITKTGAEGSAVYIEHIGGFRTSKDCVAAGELWERKNNGPNYLVKNHNAICVKK